MELTLGYHAKGHYAGSKQPIERGAKVIFLPYLTFASFKMGTYPLQASK